MGRDGAGGPGEVVVYTVRYNAPYLTRLQSLIGGNGFTLIQASAVVRNEAIEMCLGRDDGGSAMMEFVLAMPLFLLMLLGGAELGSLLLATIRRHDRGRTRPTARGRSLHREPV